MADAGDHGGFAGGPELTYEEIRANAKAIRRTPFGIQDGNGVDVTLFESQLRLTPEERIEINDNWARHVEEAHRAVRRS